MGLYEGNMKKMNLSLKHEPYPKYKIRTKKNIYP